MLGNMMCDQVAVVPVFLLITYIYIYIYLYSENIAHRKSIYLEKAHKKFALCSMPSASIILKTILAESK